MTICEEAEAHGTRFGMAYGSGREWPYIKCLDCGEAMPSQWDNDDKGPWRPLAQKEASVPIESPQQRGGSVSDPPAAGGN